MDSARQLKDMDLDQQHALLEQLREWARSLGFSQIGVADVDLTDAEAGLLRWLNNGFHGSMDYMAAHGLRRARPAELIPGTIRVITARMDYLPALGSSAFTDDNAQNKADSKHDDLSQDQRDNEADDWRAIEWQRLNSPQQATVSVYARGRDYHKVLRSRLQRLADRLAEAIGPFGHRVFTDSAPVLEVELAAKSGIGWRGKHTLILSRDAGSMFFLGEIYIDLPLPLTAPVEAHCGTCSACIDVCPTRAIIAPQLLDARRCISYLTIENAGPIPIELRPLMGNRIYGCDDCQLVCPWNKYAQRSTLADFDLRDSVGNATLLQLWSWNSADFLHHTEGSAIRRIGFERWQRNLAVAMGNALRSMSGSADRDVLIAALQKRLRDRTKAGATDSDEVGGDGDTSTPSELVCEHIEWALAQVNSESIQRQRSAPGTNQSPLPLGEGEGEGNDPPQR
jgi:epoxyqueuosine reductase